MQNTEIEELLNGYIEDTDNQGCFLIKGHWGVGKTHFITKYIATSEESNVCIKFIKVSLLEKTNLSQVASEINSKLVSVARGRFEKLAKTFTGVSIFSMGVNFDLTALLDEKDLIEKSTESNTKIIFVFDDFERTKLAINDFLGFANNLNENFGHKVIVIANIDGMPKDQFQEFLALREKVFFTETALGDDFFDIAQEIIRDSKLASHIKQFTELFLFKKHDNLRSLIFSIQKVEQILTWYKDPLDDKVIASLISAIAKYAIERADKQNNTPKERNTSEELASLLSRSQTIAYDMSFIEPFVKNEDYSRKDVIQRINDIQNFVVSNKDNPLSKLSDWAYLHDDQFRSITEQIMLWIKADKIDKIEYPNIFKTLGSDAFSDKLSMFYEIDEYFKNILELMKKNISSLTFDELEKIEISRYSQMTGKLGREYLAQLKNEIESLQKIMSSQLIDCDMLFNDTRRDLHERLNMLSIQEKDLLEVCKPGQIFEKIKVENNLEALDNLRGVLLEFYRSSYPLNRSYNEHLESLKENENVKQFISYINEYLEQEDLEKSKLFILKMMIQNLDGTYF